MIEILEPIKSVFQTLFYMVTIAVAILTYINAKKSILSPVNTEYQKRIFDRLAEVTSFLCSEFQMGSSEYYLYQLPMEETLKEITDEYERIKNDIEDKNDFHVTDYPVNPEWIKFRKKYDEVQFDPYIPEKLKTPILEYLNKRAESSSIAHNQAVSNFIRDANEESCAYVIKEDSWRLHNYFLEALEQQKCDTETLEPEVNKIKENFQEYMQSFQP